MISISYMFIRWNFIHSNPPRMDFSTVSLLLSPDFCKLMCFLFSGWFCIYWFIYLGLSASMGHPIPLDSLWVIMEVSHLMAISLVIYHILRQIDKPKYHLISYIYIHIILVGGWAYPSETYESVNWNDEIPNIWENKTCLKPPTIYYIYTHL